MMPNRPAGTETKTHPSWRIKNAQAWLKKERERQGLSVADLTLLIQQMQEDCRLGIVTVGPKDIALFEDAKATELPMWMRHAVYALDFNKEDFTSEQAKIEWQGERNWYLSRHPFDGCRPFLLYEEFKLVDHAAQLDDRQRKLLNAMLRERFGREGAFQKAADRFLLSVGLG